MLRRVTETAAGARGRSQDFIGNLFCLALSSQRSNARDDDYGENEGTIRHPDTIRRSTIYTVRAVIFSRRKLDHYPRIQVISMQLLLLLILSQITVIYFF